MLLYPLRYSACDPMFVVIWLFLIVVLYCPRLYIANVGVVLSKKLSSIVDGCISVKFEFSITCFMELLYVFSFAI